MFVFLCNFWDFTALSYVILIVWIQQNKAQSIIQHNIIRENV